MVAVLAVCCFGQHVPKSAIDAYEHVESLRDKANARSIAVLQEALRYMEQPLVRDLALGNRYLRARTAYIQHDLAIAHAAAGHREEMYASLEWLARNEREEDYAKMIAKAGELKPYAAEERFRKVLASLQQPPLWETAAFRTPFQENLTDTEKIAGLSKFWSEVKYNFIYTDKLRALDWDKQYFDYIPRILATKSTAEYYQVLRELCAKLEDGHTNVYPPSQLPLMAPAMRTALIENRVFITAVPSPALRAGGFVPGSEITSIDGVPAVEYGRTKVMPYVSSSTPQDRDQRSFGFELLRGPRGSTVRLGLTLPSGEKKEHALERAPATDWEPTPAFAWKMMPGDIALVSLNTFGNNRAAEEFERNFEEIAKAKAIIFDVRENGGGSSGVGWRVLSMMTDKAFPTGSYRFRLYVPTHRAWGQDQDWLDEKGGEFRPHGTKLYTKPVIVLSSPRTFSAAEDFLIAFQSMKRGRIVGEASGGSTGQPLQFALPGGGTGRVCTKQDMYPDGRLWVGIGIQPDVPVKPTVEDVRAGRDTVLETALALLRK